VNPPLAAHPIYLPIGHVFRLPPPVTIISGLTFTPVGEYYALRYCTGPPSCITHAAQEGKEPTKSWREGWMDPVLGRMKLLSYQVYNHTIVQSIQRVPRPHWRDQSAHHHPSDPRSRVALVLGPCRFPSQPSPLDAVSTNQKNPSSLRPRNATLRLLPSSSKTCRDCD
jgi:hypothetical protein